MSIETLQAALDSLFHTVATVIDNADRDRARLATLEVRLEGLTNIIAAEHKADHRSIDSLVCSVNNHHAYFFALLDAVSKLCPNCHDLIGKTPDAIRSIALCRSIQLAALTKNAVSAPCPIGAQLPANPPLADISVKQ